MRGCAKPAGAAFAAFAFLPFLAGLQAQGEGGVSPAGFLLPGGSLAAEFRTNGERTAGALGGPLQAAGRSTAELVGAGGETIALATVVASDGLLVTKASELPDDLELTVRLPGGRSQSPYLAGLDAENDLALLKVTAYDLHPVRWSDDPAPLGTWVAAPAADPSRLRLGVVSAQQRPIERLGGVIGVGLGRDGDELGGVEVNRVYPGTAAAAVGIKRGDVITEIDGRAFRARDELIEYVSSHEAGDFLVVVVDREGERVEFEVILGHRTVFFDLFSRNQRMSGPTSSRRYGFSTVLQHDAPMKPEAMGGPLLGLDGRVLGVNIARADRVTCFALPAEVVRAAVAKLRGDG